MKLIINIDEKVFRMICEGYPISDTDKLSLKMAIADGVPLRMLDRDTFERRDEE